MGVPKFYRWISERYTKINEIVTDQALLPEFDHLYLDMNGIIHGCTHPSHMDISDVISEKDMMLGIMHYLDKIITQIAKPKVSVYMAIDGVAPRAKLNQQRSRRFRSAKDMAEATKDMAGSDKKVVFDSNCITPGTEFLAKVSHTIQYWIRKKLKEDPLWKDLTVIFSGHDIPGEGEHKIMQHIREMRSSPAYQPNTRHCIYGQDADLIMLALVTHEPHFTILREIVDFNSFSRNKNSLKEVKKFTKESDFQLLHISVLREYLELEFCKVPGKFDLERVVDDFVFITFLVGNDFLPHMPTLDISDGAFDLLFDLYTEQRESWPAGEYLTDAGEIPSPERLEVFLAAIGSNESEILAQKEKDDKVYMKKRRKWDQRDGRAPSGPTDSQLAAQEIEKQGDYQTMLSNMLAKVSINEQGTSDDFVVGWQPAPPGAKDYKGRYYFEKMRMTPIDKDAHWTLRKSYMEGLMWCLAYYYKGCISWGWFYPYHYGPMLSDLLDLPKMFSEISFDLGEPLKPFEQLMGCLPPASGQLVPKHYRSLMTAPESPIIRFYPQDFEVDMNGKKNPWEGVNLLPFIDIKLLKSTIAEQCPDNLLSSDQRKRNTTGKVYCYRHDLTCKDTIPSPNPKIGLPDIVGSHSSVSVMEIQESIGVPFAAKLIEGTQLPYPGFPSLRVLPIEKVEMTKIGLNCFGTASKYPNTILTLHEMPQLPPIETLSQTVLGKSLFVNWPMMHEAKVVSICDGNKEVRLAKGKTSTKVLDKKASDAWMKESAAMTAMYYVGHGVPGAGGVQINEIKYRLKVLPLQGMRTNPANGSTKKLFGKQEADVPLQLALWQAPAPDPRFNERGPLSLEGRFPTNSVVVLTKGKHRGCRGVVAGVADKKNLAVNVDVIPTEIPFGLAVARSVQESYMPSHEAARMLKINPGLFGKVTGALQFEQNRYDLGLHLKSADGSCVVGYTRRKIDTSKKSNKAWEAGDSVRVFGSSRENGGYSEERIQWEYTPAAVRLVDEYRRTFPQLFAGITKAPNERRYNAKTIFGPNGEATLPVIREWLNKHPSAKLPRSPASSTSMSYSAVGSVQRAADVRQLALKKKGFPKQSLIKIPGSALYREGSTSATDVLLASDLNDGVVPELGDRVVNLCADGIPFGARGTVVAVHEASTTGSVEVVMDEEFVGGTNLQGACSNFRGKLCVWAHLLRIVPENSENMVRKMVPKGTGKADVKRIMSSIERQLMPEGAPPQSEADATAEKTAVVEKQPVVSSPESRSSSRSSRPETRTPPRSTSRAGSNARAGSAKQGRADYKEARKPDERGVGFKRPKKAESGFSRWKKLVSNRSGGTRNDASQLKAILGVTDSSKSTEEKLKNMLGIAPPAAPVPQDASAGLKAMLGVTPPVHHLEPPQPPPPPASMLEPQNAAEKLLQIMSNKQPQYVQDQRPYSSGVPSTAFNFTYVEEGQQAPVFPPQGSPPLQYPYPPPNHASGYPPQGPPPTSIPQPNMNSVHTPSVIAGASSKDFPALGETETSAASEGIKDEPPLPPPPPENFLTPSIIATKGKH